MIKLEKAYGAEYIWINEKQINSIEQVIDKTTQKRIILVKTFAEDYEIVNTKEMRKILGIEESDND